MERGGPIDGTKQPKEDGVSSVAILDETRALMRGLEEKEMRKGLKQPDARKRLAARLSVVPGTLTSLAKNRLKKIDASLRDRVRTLVIRELEQEIGRLTHELSIHKATGLRLDCAAVAEAETHLAAAKAILAGAGP